MPTRPSSGNAFGFHHMMRATRQTARLHVQVGQLPDDLRVQFRQRLLNHRHRRFVRKAAAVHKTRREPGFFHLP